MKILLSIFTLLCFTGLIAQETSNPTSDLKFVQVSGFIKSSDTTSVGWASVYNPRNKMVVLTNEYGYFNIIMTEKDTLEVACVGYEKKRFWLPSGYSATSYQTAVYLKRIVYTLGNVRIGLVDWDNFMDAFNKVPFDKANPIIGDVSAAARTYREAKRNFGYTINGPFSYLYNKFSKKARSMEKLEELLAQDDIKMEANKKLTSDLIQQVTDLSPEDIEQFLQFCDIGNDYAARASTYDLMVTIRDCYEYYKKSKPYFDKQNEIHGTSEDGSDTSDDVEVDIISPESPRDSTQTPK